MARISIIAVDDDRAVLNSVERDLRQKYGRDYRVLKAESGAAALGLLEELKQREEPVALFVVDQRMPNMTGVEFLEQAAPLFPEARKVLLTAYADTDAAINAINKVSLHWQQDSSNKTRRQPDLPMTAGPGLGGPAGFPPAESRRRPAG